MCHVCGITGQENFCMKKYEPDYVEKEKEWGNFLKVENNNMEGGSVTYKWHRAGGVAMNGGRDGGSGNLGGVYTGKGWTEGKKDGG